MTCQRLIFGQIFASFSHDPRSFEKIDQFVLPSGSHPKRRLLQIVKERLKIHASTSEKVEKYTFHMAKCQSSRKPQYAN